MLTEALLDTKSYTVVVREAEDKVAAALKGFPSLPSSVTNLASNTIMTHNVISASVILKWSLFVVGKKIG